MGRSRPRSLQNPQSVHLAEEGATHVYRLVTAVTLIGAAAALGACKPANGGEEESSAGSEANVVTVEAKDFESDIPEAIPSGWNTLRLVNEGEQEHFVLVGRIPDDRSIAEYRSEVSRTFVDAFDRYGSAELTREQASQTLADELPSLLFEIQSQILWDIVSRLIGDPSVRPPAESPTRRPGAVVSS